MPLTAGTPLKVLTERLERAGWGDLGTPSLSGLRNVLGALSRVLDPRAGAGKITAPQLAEMTGYTERWVRRCLGLLEELEVIEWHRGGIVNGKPAPSWIRVSKAVLVDLIHIARAQQGERQSAAAVETRRRIARLHTGNTHPARRAPLDRKRARSSRGGSHPELNTALLSTEEVPGANGHPGGPLRAGPTSEKDEAPASPDSARSAIARIRADLAARRSRGSGKERRSEDDEAAG